MIHILQSMMNSSNASTSHHHHHGSRKYKKRNSSASSIHAATGVARAIASTRSTTLDRLDLRAASPMPTKRIASKFSGRELALEDDQIDLLVVDFAKISDKFALFEKMFLNLFLRDDPDIAAVFGLANVGEKDMRRRNAFRTHVCKFMRFWTTVMDLLPKRGREEELIQIIRMVGRQHCNVKTLSFTAARWLAFKAALMNTFIKLEQEKTAHAWSILIGFLIYEVKDAYLSHVGTSPTRKGPLACLQIRQVRSNSVPHVLEAYRFDFRRASNRHDSLCDEDNCIAE